MYLQSKPTGNPKAATHTDYFEQQGQKNKNNRTRRWIGCVQVELQVYQEETKNAQHAQIFLLSHLEENNMYLGHGTKNAGKCQQEM